MYNLPEKENFDDSITKEALDEYGYDVFTALKKDYELQKLSPKIRDDIFKHWGFEEFPLINKELSYILKDDEERSKLEDLLEKKKREADLQRRQFWGDRYNFFKNIEDAIEASGMADSFATYFGKTKPEWYARFFDNESALNTDKHFYAYTMALFNYNEKVMSNRNSDFLLRSAETELKDYLNKSNPDEDRLRSLLLKRSTMMSTTALLGMLSYTLSRERPVFGELSWINDIKRLAENGLSMNTLKKVVSEGDDSGAFYRLLPLEGKELRTAEIGILLNEKKSGLKIIGEIIVSCYDRRYINEIRRGMLYYLDEKLIEPRNQEHEMALLYYRSINGLYGAIKNSAYEILDPINVVPMKKRARRKLRFRR
jgi:hypothetical protein